MPLHIFPEIIKTGNDVFLMTVNKTIVIWLPEVLRKSFKFCNDLVRYRAVETPWYRDHGHGMDIFVQFDERIHSAIFSLKSSNALIFCAEVL